MSWMLLRASVAVSIYANGVAPATQPRSNCNWIPGRDFLAAGAPPQNASTKEECCEVCHSTPSCVAGVWCPPSLGCGLGTGRCYTKFSTTTPRNTSTRVIAW